MKKYGDTLRLSASDLAAHLGCRHLTALETAVAEGRLKRPMSKDPALEALIERGRLHEKAYVDHLRATGASITEMPEEEAPDAGFERTCEAMRAGADVITQAWLVKDPWYGRADILRRVDRPSRLGPWSYQVEDTKLARETRAGTVLQLSSIPRSLAACRARFPELMFVISPGTRSAKSRLRVLDYYGVLPLHPDPPRSRDSRDIVTHMTERTTYPEPVPHCDVCRWWLALRQAAARRRSSLPRRRHLFAAARQSSSGAGSRRSQALAKLKVPLDPRPERGSQESYARVHHQARIQLEGRLAQAAAPRAARSARRARARASSRAPTRRRLPRPRGRPVRRRTGREYLFGWVAIGTDGSSVYRCRWAMTAEEEKAAFEALVDELTASWKRHPDFHVYHYAAYEPSALKRLMGRYATREDEIDRMLRAGKFVDLYAVVRQWRARERRAVLDQGARGVLRIRARDRSSRRRREASRVENALELGDAATLDRRHARRRRAVQPRRLRLGPGAARLARSAARGG